LVGGHSSGATRGHLASSTLAGFAHGPKSNRFTRSLSPRHALFWTTPEKRP